MDLRSYRVRVAALLAAGALAVHQLRYVIAYGHESGPALGEQGHAYLAVVAPAVALLMGLAAAAFVVCLLDARGARVARAEASGPLRLWLLSSVSLLLTYAVQEWVEGQLEPGHPAGVAAVFGHGGWTAALLAIAVGGLVALLARGAAAAIERVARDRGRRVRRVLPPVPRFTHAHRVAPDPLACHLAGRGPPLPAG
jgi:hypothetical protein